MTRKHICALAVAFLMSVAGICAAQNPIAHIKETPGMAAIFRSWGFIGDSLCSGEMQKVEDGDMKYIDMYEYSWGYHIARICGVEGFNYAYGGQTAKGWLTRPGPRTWEGASKTPKQAYIIALGCNDAGLCRNGKLKCGSLETDVYRSDCSKNADTYAGHMAAIIQKLQSVQPNAKIFVVTMPREDGPADEINNKFNDVIRGLPHMFGNVYLIDLYRYAPVYNDEFRAKYFLYGHLSAAGYLYTAYMLLTYIDWIVTNKPEEFKDVPFI